MPLTQAQLEKHLWRAADILPGRIDSGDYKHDIFGLLFFKPLSDFWREEYEERLKRYEDEKLRLRGVFQDVDFTTSTRRGSVICRASA